MTDRRYRFIALATAGVLLAWVGIGMLYGPDGDPGAILSVLWVSAAVLLSVFIVASVIHVYWGRRG
jgi:hypothetical protein